MAKYSDQQVAVAVAPHLQSGESIVNSAYGFWQPDLGCLGWIPIMAIKRARLSKFYLAVLTDRRFLVLKLKSGFGEPVAGEVLAYPFDALPQARVQKSTFATRLELVVLPEPVVINFPTVGVPSNPVRGAAIADWLAARKDGSA